MENLEELLVEAFHTYQVYLECTMVLTDHQAKLPLLKWPDVAQAAITYALAWERKNPLETRQTPEIIAARVLLLKDLHTLIVRPIEIIYDSTRARVKKVLGKEPAGPPPEKNDNVFQRKNDTIRAINDMFRTLETMTGVKYPKLSRRKTNGSNR